MIVLGIFDNIFDMVAGDMVRDITHQAVGSVVDIGKEQLSKGIECAKKSIHLEMLKSNPQKLSTEIINLGRKNKGELTVGQVMSQYSLDQASATIALERLVSKDICILRYVEDKKIYIFPGFKGKKPVKLCEYCGNTYGVKEITKNECPTCGAPLIDSSVFV